MKPVITQGAALFAALALISSASVAAATAKAAPAKSAKKPAAQTDRGNSDDPEVLATETEHVVKPGETLGGIANRARVPRILIAEANRLKEPYHVRTGQKLLLPRTRHHIVKKGETGFDIAYQYGVPYTAIAIANGMTASSPVKAGQKLLIPTVLHPSAETAVDKGSKSDNRADTGADDRPDKPDTPEAAPATAPKFIWPVDGKLRRGFTPRDAKNYHDGIDIIAKPDSAVRATAPGRVLFAGDEPQSFGRLVVIDHGGGWQSAYGFLGKMTVAKGDQVALRERIGLVGHSGRATADELHFELRRANKPVDPADLLPAKPAKKPAAKAETQMVTKPKPKAKTPARS